MACSIHAPLKQLKSSVRATLNRTTDALTGAVFPLIRYMSCHVMQITMSQSARHLPIFFADLIWQAGGARPLRDLPTIRIRGGGTEPRGKPLGAMVQIDGRADSGSYGRGGFGRSGGDVERSAGCGSGPALPEHASINAPTASTVSDLNQKIYKQIEE